MAQIGKDYYEDLTAAKLRGLIDALARGEVPMPGPQNGRFAAEPLGGPTTLHVADGQKQARNASVQLAHDIGDTVKRIDGTEVPLLSPWQKTGPAGSAHETRKAALANTEKTPGPKPAADKPADKTGITKQEANAKSAAKPVGKSNP